MPLYDFKCECGVAVECIAKIDEKVKCQKCGQTMKRQMPFTHGVNMGASGAYGYYDENLETYISTNKQRREVMRKQGVGEAYGKGWY